MQRINTDKLGMILSIGCAIHCVLLPIILPLLPFLGFIIGHDSNFHFILGAGIVIIALFALLPGFKKHQNIRPIFLASLGIIYLFTSGILEISGTAETAATIITIMGSIFLTSGHYLNHKLSCKCRHHEEHGH